MGKVLAQTTILDIWNLEMSLLDHVIYRLFININSINAKVKNEKLSKKVLYKLVIFNFYDKLENTTTDIE